MSRIARFAVLVAALMSLLGVMSSTAGAVHWTNDGDTAFTAGGGAGTLSSTGAFLVTTGSDVRGVTTTPLAGINAPVVDATITFTGVSISGQSLGLECGVTLTAASQTTVAPRVTSGTADATCGVYLANVKICHLEGTVAASYTNPTAPSTFGRLTTTTGGTLRATNAVANCPLGANDLAHLSPLTFTVTAGTGGPTPHLGPSITAT
jgi:hypothetical protein